MKALVIYESMYGNTHHIASAIAEGFRRHGEALVVPVGDAGPDLVASADVVVVGGPTHAHGMSHDGTRKGARVAAEKPGSGLVLDPHADDPGLRDWLATLDHPIKHAAAFDTRFDLPSAVTGRASKGIARRLRHHGASLLCEPESFFVTRDNHLEPYEEGRARDWGAQVALALESNASSHGHS